MNEMIRASNLSKRFKLNAIDFIYGIKDVDLVIYEGEFVCIMGPSGAGKSTLINNITTIDRPTNGTLKIAGQNIITMSGYRLSEFRYQYLGFIFQNFNLLDILNVYENIAMPLITHGVAIKEIDDRVKAISKKLGIFELLNKNPNECSGGQQQRISIARALITEPKLIVADEPTGNLDSTNAHEIMKLFKQYNKENKTVVMVSHDSMIASYASRVVYITDGKIEKEIRRENKTKREFFSEVVALNANKTVIER